jgi:hypothetical protein
MQYPGVRDKGAEPSTPVDEQAFFTSADSEIPRTRSEVGANVYTTPIGVWFTAKAGRYHYRLTTVRETSALPLADLAPLIAFFSIRRKANR